MAARKRFRSSRYQARKPRRHVSARSAVILDLAQAEQIAETGGLRPRPGRNGTIGYLGPEQENDSLCAVQAPSGAALYDYRIDIFALSVVFLGILPETPDRPAFTRTWNHRQNNEQQDTNIFLSDASPARLKLYEKALEMLRKAEKNSLTSLIAQMLEYRPQDRITAKKALEHPSISQIVEEERVKQQQEITGTGSKQPVDGEGGRNPNGPKKL